jgi:predicted HTH domain antitoxin
MVLAEVDMPGSILTLIKVDPDQLSQYIKRSLAVELYREGKLSLGKAAELAGIRGKWEMLMLLSERGVPLDYSAEDAKDDLRTLREVLSR